jgi:hypothetical protein
MHHVRTEHVPGKGGGVNIARDGAGLERTRRGCRGLLDRQGSQRLVSTGSRMGRNGEMGPTHTKSRNIGDTAANACID